MTKNNDYRKGVCQCRKCGRVFHQKDVKTIQVERCGLIINERVCPHCGCNTYGLVEYPASEEKLIYKSNFPSELKLHMDLLVDQILKEDNLEAEQMAMV